MVRKRIALAQNFLKDPRLVRQLVKNSSLTKEELVLEIGPGEGIITAELTDTAGKVIAVEKDSTLAAELRKKLKNKPNLEILEGDFLNLSPIASEYKIFSNIPFNRTADILKQILKSKHLNEAYLIMQAEAAAKYSGMPKETEVSVLAKPWFDFEVMHQFARTDFEPVPSVEVVMLHIQRRVEPLIATRHESLYRQFVRTGFRSTRENLSLAYKKIFTYEQWKRLARDLSFTIKVKPTELRFEQWLALFKYFLTGVSEEKKRLLIQ
ncbi:MAG TPA: 23S ribosomal RNA methyltransferase Erm [Pyrinomonadaceae bacterium]|nr:23S ribosomal RNA methyltransferase Erm [Pyrinomonadaceae bacterium]